MAGETAPQRALRYLFIGLLFAGVLWGFWQNGQRRHGQTQKPSSAVVDAGRDAARSAVRGAGFLTPAQEQDLNAFAGRFSEAYGLDLSIRLSNGVFGGLAEPGGRNKADIVLHLDPPARQARLALSARAEARLGPALILYLRLAHFPPYFARNAWPEGLASALNLLVRRLDAEPLS